MIDNIFKKFTDVVTLAKNASATLQQCEEAQRQLMETIREAETAKKEAEAAKQEAVALMEKVEEKQLTPKERATVAGEPWVAVMDTHVNRDNIRNGFFELDWNEQFIVELKNNGYGVSGDSDESIIDRWFRELCANVVVDDGFDIPISTGNLNINNVKRDNV